MARRAVASLVDGLRLGIPLVCTCDTVEYRQDDGFSRGRRCDCAAKTQEFPPRTVGHEMGVGEVWLQERRGLPMPMPARRR